MSVFRRPKTRQEAAANQDFPVRAKRKLGNLANAWDDLDKTFQRTWKKFRRKQYKTV